MDVLIGTETYHKAGAPHMVATLALNSHAINREEEYKDVVGFFKEDKDVFPESLHDGMKDWVRTLNKNMVFVLKQEKRLMGWLYFKNNDQVDFREIQVYTNNDINYDLWLDPESSFWNPVDFLLEAEYFEHPIVEENPVPSELDTKVDALSKKVETLNATTLQLASVIKGLLQAVQPK